MKRILLAALFMSSFALFAQSAAEKPLPKFIKLHHYQAKPAETMRIDVKSHSGKGSLHVEDKQGGHDGQVQVDWVQLLDRTEFLEAGVRKLRYRVLADRVVTTVSIDGKKNATTKVSPLVGESVEGMQDSFGRWRLFLDHMSGSEQVKMLEELETYESRQWFVEPAVRVGDSWAFRPSFIKHLMERDLKGSELDAKMKLESIEYQGEVPVAKLGFTILSKGASAEADAQMFLKGEVHVDLTTMLDFHVQMDGFLHTEAEAPGVLTKLKIPLHFTVKQSIKKP